MAQIKQKTSRDTVKAVVNFEQEIELKEAALAKRRKLWNAINHFVRVNGGWLARVKTRGRFTVAAINLPDFPLSLSNQYFRTE